MASSGGSGKAQIGFKRCRKCGYHVIRPYFKYHECSRKKDGTIDKWQSYDPAIKGRK